MDKTIFSFFKFFSEPANYILIKFCTSRIPKYLILTWKDKNKTFFHKMVPKIQKKRFLMDKTIFIQTNHLINLLGGGQAFT
jgi:hypothetical protein